MKIDSSKVNLAEKDIEDWLWENPEKLSFGWGGNYKVKEWVGRQVRVPSGVIDLLGVFELAGHTAFVIVEIKNTEFTQASLLQVCRYATDILDIAQDYSIETDNRFVDHVHKIVVAKGEVTNQLLFEANSIDVEMISFHVSYELHTGGSWKFGSEFRDENKKILNKLRDSKDFRKYIDDYVPEIIEDFINSIPDKGED